MENSLPKMVRAIVSAYPELPAQHYKNSEGIFEPVSYKDFFNAALNFSGGLLSLGVKRGDPIGIIADNRKEWQQSDMGIMAIGAVDVPRGCDATVKDLQYILSFTECALVIAENSSQIKKILSIKSELPKLKRIIYFDSPTEAEISEAKKQEVEFFSYDEIIKRGIYFRADNKNFVEQELELE